jgi:hypothetical protein
MQTSQSISKRVNIQISKYTDITEQGCERVGLPIEGRAGEGRGIY